jgi:hypothetical protein
VPGGVTLMSNAGSRQSVEMQAKEPSGDNRGEGAAGVRGFQFRLVGFTDSSRWHTPPLRYPRLYALFILVSSLDIVFTWIILSLGGREINPLAREVIDNWGLNGAILFKFSLVVFVIVSCDVIGRQRDRLGRFVAHLAVWISAIPVVYSPMLMLLYFMITSRA